MNLRTLIYFASKFALAVEFGPKNRAFAFFDMSPNSVNGLRSKIGIFWQKLNSFLFRLAHWVKDIFNNSREEQIEAKWHQIAEFEN
jgi:hypothetical protein